MKQLSMSYPAEKIDPRVKALVAAIGQHADFRAVNLSASRVVVMAILEGLDVLEKRYGLAEG